MKITAHVITALLVSGFALSGVIAGPAAAQDKAKGASAAKAEKGKPVTKVIHDDDKLRVTETTSQPGDVSASIVRPPRVVRWLQGGTIMRIYDDGKTETIERKTGEVAVSGQETRAWAVKNVGKTPIVTYIVVIKQPKK